MIQHPRLDTDLNAACQWLGGAAVMGKGAAREMTDPATGKMYGTFPDADAGQLDRAVKHARGALKVWADCDPDKRARILHRVSELITENADHLGAVEAVNVGKPLPQALRDVGRAAEYFRFYAGACDKLQGDTIPSGPDQTVFTVNEPVGVTVHILPWNYPVSTLARGVAPALAAGATVVAKPSELTPFTAVMLARIAAQAGLPDGVFNVVTGGGDIGTQLAGHSEIDHVTFTGSTATGRKVMQAASAPVAGVTLELGGKSPIIVLDDADLDAAAEGVLRGIFFNAGQVCAAGSRLVCTPGIHEALISKVAAKARAMTLGHPLDSPDIGPLVNSGQIARVEGFVDRAKAAGHRLALGGSRSVLEAYPNGYFYPPTIFANPPPQSEIARDEVFGPVLVSQLCDDADHALALANDSDFGLVAGIYTCDGNTALRLARQVQAGQVFVNGFLTANDSVPFGGVKRSGIGREKGLAGLAAYLSPKAIVLNHGK
ncbi:aldehyde dehydrogenase family protein [Ruegeria sp. SCP11]|uniref:aldehyde dehydrogenase family protein n=1 Tax=Ruegeria sp. SCP11 TaxID=3141378 RepID=UPI00333BB440